MFCSNWKIEFPFPSEAPVMLPTGELAAVHKKPVPVILAVSTTEVVLPEQKVCTTVLFVTDGIGLTVTLVFDEAVLPLASVTVT